MRFKGLARTGIGILMGLPLRVLALDQGEIAQMHVRRLGQAYAPVYRQEAASALVRLGPSSLPWLIEALKDRDSTRQIHVIEVLGDLRDLKAADYLLRRFENSSSTLVRCKIMEALGKLRHPGLYDFIAGQVEASDPSIHCFAIWALGEMRLRKAVPLLLRILRTENGYAVVTAIDALGKCGTPDQAPFLLEYLKYENIQTRFVTAKALGEIGDGRLAPLLLHAMAKEPDPEVQETLARTLGKIGGDPAVEKLVQLLKESAAPTWQHLAEAGLESAGLRAAFALMPLLRENDLRLRVAAAKILGAIHAPGAVPYLIQMAEEDDPAARVAAIAALGDCADMSAMKFLTQMARSRDRSARQAASEAMRRIASRNEQLYQEARRGS